MKLTRKLTALAVTAALSAGSVFAFDVTKLDLPKLKTTMDNGLGDFAAQLAVAVPQAATQQNVWADAWIGSLFPGLRFGGGVNFGLTNVNTEGLASAAKALGISGIEDTYKFPVITADIRIGGLIIPFDADIAFIKTGAWDLLGSDLSVEFTTVGFDFRYAVLEGNLVMPRVSVGAGYFYNQGTFKASSGNGEAIVDYNIHTFYLQGQISKDFSIPIVRIGFTPFVGGRLFASKHDNSYEWRYKGKAATAVDAALAAAGLPSMTSGSGTEKSDMFDFNNMQPQLYGGIGFNFALLQVTASVCIDPRTFAEDKTWTGALSVRVRH